MNHLLACLVLSVLAMAAQAETGTIKLGVLTDLSGPYADGTGQGSVEAASMAVEDAGGEALGKPIEILSADHQNKADVGSAIARRWYEAEGVDAIIDVPNTAVALAVQELTRQNDKVFLMSGPASTVLTGKSCSPNGIMWTYDTYALAHGTGQAVVREGGDSWFFLAADYSFGQSVVKDTSEVVKANGGKVLGDVRHPLGTADFSSFLLQAQGSGAKVVALANAGADTINAIKQAHEFGLTQKLAGMLIFVTDVHALGLETAKGLLLTDAWYWDMDEPSRAFARRWSQRMGGKMPTYIQAGVYSAVRHYLKAMQAAKTEDAKTVIAKMKSMPIDDFFAHNGKIREDGRMVHDLYLIQVKSPAESKGPWDYYKVLRTIPGDEAFLPLSASECPLVRHR